MTVWVNVLREDKSLPMPEFNYEGDAGFDLRSAEDVVIYPNMPLPAKISTGMRFSIPLGYCMEVHSRSGLAAKNHLFVTNGPGIIDSVYTGIVYVLLTNLGEDPVHIKHGQRIAQGIIKKLPEVIFKEVDTIKETKRGDKGFGSSGI